jgi:type III secretion system FlhB-like substrate exporter
MTDTINDVAAETGAQDEPAVAAIDEQGIAEQLVAQAREKGIELVGPNGLLSQLTKRVLETALEVEMTDHLGYDKHDPVGRNRGNSRNGSRPKTVLTDIGPVEIDVPRDLDASFTPMIVKKRQRRLTGVDQIVLSLSARGLTTGEISAHLAEVYGASVSKETVSKITDQVLEEMSAWMNRPLDEVYPVIFIDAIVVKVRDGQVRNKPIYVVIGVSVHGERDILGPVGRRRRRRCQVLVAGADRVEEPGRPRRLYRSLRRPQGTTGRDHHGVGAGGGAGLHHPPDPQHIPLRLPEVLGSDRPRPPAGLHRRHRGRGAGPVRRVRREVEQALSGDQPVVAQRVVGVRAVPGLRRGDPQDHL